MDATALRWVLAIIGIIIIAGVYLFASYQHKLRRRAAIKTFTHDELDAGVIEDETLSRELSSINTMLDQEDLKPEVEAIHINPALDKVEPVKLPQPATVILPQELLKIDARHRVAHVLKPDDDRVLTGNELVEAFAELELTLNKEFYTAVQEENCAQINIADLTESGSFARVQSDAFVSHGMVCFFDLSSFEQSEHCYELMLKKIDEMVRLLDLKVYDENFNLLTLQHVTETRNRLRDATS